MADINAAIAYVLTFEDADLSGVITTDSGGRTRFGIAERFHPELTACLFYTSMGSTAALQIAKGIYDISYAEPLCIADIENQAVANKLLSLGVNLGVIEAAKMLQLTLRVNGDGRIGPLTLHALEMARPEEVIESLDDMAVAFYHSIVEKDPSKQKYLEGWLKRAEA